LTNPFPQNKPKAAAAGEGVRIMRNQSPHPPSAFRFLAWELRIALFKKILSISKKSRSIEYGKKSTQPSAASKRGL
jgi:hypothetical protein